MRFPQALSLIAGPPVSGVFPLEPVTLAEAKKQIEDLDENYQDSFIRSLVTAARIQAENVTGRALITQTWEAVYDDWPCDGFYLPRPPLQSVESIKYKDSDGTESTWSSDEYIVDTDSEPGRVALGYSEVYPNATLRPISAIRVRFVAGYPAIGTGTISSTGTAVTGSSTAFDTEVAANDTIIIPGQRKVVSAVGSATSITLSSAFSSNLSAGTAFKIGGTKHDVPHPIRQAILLIVGHLYAHREEVMVGQVQTMAAQMPMGAVSLLAPYKVQWFA